MIFWSKLLRRTMALARHAVKNRHRARNHRHTAAAQVTAHSIASINQIAPGRVFLGCGHRTRAMRVMGQDPMRTSEFREYLRAPALLAGEAVQAAYGQDARNKVPRPATAASINLKPRIRFMPQPTGRRRWKQPAPLPTARSRLRRAAARDQTKLDKISQGAARAKRTLPTGLPYRFHHHRMRPAPGREAYR